MTEQTPIPDSYWVRPERLMAGEYPCSPVEDQARRKLRWLLDRGVTFFLDLTEPGESGLKPYAHLLAEEAEARGQQVEHCRQSIPDMHAPSSEQMVRTLDELDRALENGRCVYVHCFGGIGRTGTVVGCYLARHGLLGEAALEQIADWRRGTPDGWKRSPETDAQRQLVLGWQAGQ